MPNLALLIAFWPLVCCEACDYSPACVTVSIVTALILYVVASIVHELRLLSVRRLH